VLSVSLDGVRGMREKHVVDSPCFREMILVGAWEILRLPERSISLWG